MSIPKHVAIIPDGNRRWATEKNLNPLEGHKKAGDYENLKKIINEAIRLKIKYLGLWCFSTENWRRSKTEIDNLFRIFAHLIDKCEEDLKKEKIRFLHFGRKDRIPYSLREKIKRLERITKNYDNFYLILYLDYGGRDEIIRAVNKAVKNRKKVNEKSFAKMLYTAEIPEPDLIIRTGGEMRLSGFMPYQSTYSELYFTKKYFPDFNALDLRNTVKKFLTRERRFGK